MLWLKIVCKVLTWYWKNHCLVYIIYINIYISKIIWNNKLFFSQVHLQNITQFVSSIIYNFLVFSYVAVTIGKYPQYQGDSYDMHRELNRVGVQLWHFMHVWPLNKFLTQFYVNIYNFCVAVDLLASCGINISSYLLHSLTLSEAKVIILKLALCGY